VGISRLPLWNLETKSHLDVTPMERCEVYYKEEGGAFPQIRAVVNLMSPRSPVALLSTKSAPIVH
jgi:hypothetical protein